MNSLVPHGGVSGDAGDRFVDSFRHEDLVDSTAYAFSFSGGGYRRTGGTSGAPHGLAALLWQAEWWRPQAGPPVRVVEMTDTHRLHTARFVLGRATFLLGMPADMVKQMPLFLALLTAAPALPLPGEPGWDDMLKRAEHWSTCPRNRDLGAPACSPDCKRRVEDWRDFHPRELPIDYDGDAAGVNGL